MKFCWQCGSEISDNTRFCPNCGISFEQNTAGTHSCQNIQVEKPDKFNSLLFMVSMLIPLFGIIYGACIYRTRKREAGGCLLGALISIVVFLLLPFVVLFWWA